MFIENMRVVCINDTWQPWVLGLYKNLPRKGFNYTIRTVGVGITDPSFNKGEDGKVSTSNTKEEFIVTLQEMVNPPDPFNKYGEELGFSGERFAPIEEITEEEIMNMKISEGFEQPIKIKAPAEKDLVPSRMSLVFN